MHVDSLLGKPTNTYTHSNKHTDTYTHSNIHIDTYTYSNIHTDVDIHSNIYIDTDIRKSNIYTDMSTHTVTCTQTWTQTDTDTHTDTYTQMHTHEPMPGHTGTVSGRRRRTRTQEASGDEGQHSLPILDNFCTIFIFYHIHVSPSL